MALVIPGIGGTFSGQLMGATFTKNGIVRKYAIPVNPNTGSQQVAKQVFAFLTDSWLSVLTQAQRDSWQAYAANVLLPNRLGIPQRVNPLAMYTRCNSPRLYNDTLNGTVELGVLADAPTVFNIGAPPQISPPPTAAAGTQIDGEFSYVLADNTFLSEDDGALIVYAGGPVDPTIQFFKGPFRYIGRVLGDTALPPASPQSVVEASFASAPLRPVSAGQKVFFRLQAAYADGRLSTGVIISAIVT